MANWAKGIDFANATNTTRLGGIGMYGTDNTTEKIYIGFGTEPWSNTGLEITSSNITYKGNDVYHAGNKPTATDVGALTESTANTKYMRQEYLNSYYGMTANGSASSFVRTTNSGIIPYQSGGASSLGTISWPFNNIYGNNIYDNGVLLEDKFSSASHTHDYLALSGGSLTGTVNDSFTTNTYLAGNQGKTLINSTCVAGSYTMLYNYPSTNGFFTTGGYQGSYLLQYTDKATTDAGTNSVTKSVTLLNESGNSSFPGTVSASSFSGNATSASKLATARTINGTNFDGSSAITTANWGTGRTITIGSTAKSVNGSTDVSWTLNEIGAASSVHTHDYLPLSGGTLTGSLTMANSTAGQIKHTKTDGTTVPTMYMTNADNLRVGEATTPLHLHSSVNPYVYVSNAGYLLYHTGNKPTKSDVGLSLVNNWGASSSISANSTVQYATTNMVAQVRAEKANSSHTHDYLPLTGGTVTGSLSVSGESKFSNGAYTDPWNGVACAIKASGHVGISGNLKVDGSVRASDTIYTTDRVVAEVSLGAGTGGIDTYGRIWQGQPASALYIYTADQPYGVGFDYQSYLRCQNDCTWASGHPSWRWSTIYCRNGISTGSDGRWKKHIKYIVSEEDLNDLASDYEPSEEDYVMSTFAYEGDTVNEPSLVLSSRSSEKVYEYTKDLYANDITLDVTTNDLYNFFKDDFQLSSYRFDINMYHDNKKRNNELNNVGFIAQDIVNTKVGKLFIIEPEEDEEYPNDEQGYTYNLQNYVSVIAGALKTSIKEIEKLKKEIELLKAI